MPTPKGQLGTVLGSVKTAYKGLQWYVQTADTIDRGIFGMSVRMERATKDERLGVRLNAEQKEIITAAAQALGLSVSAYMIYSALEKASHVTKIKLNREESAAFGKLLIDDSGPSKKAISAIRKAREYPTRL
jgi:uncharacterized protein (DUF1778 family)